MNPNANRPLFIIVSIVGIVAIMVISLALMKTADQANIQNTVSSQSPMASSTELKTVGTDASMFNSTPFETTFELVTGTFTFKVMCDGKIHDEQIPCASEKQLVVVRDERPTGATLVEEKVLATVTTTKDDMVIFKALAVPGLGEGKDIVVDFRTMDRSSLGLCMTDQFSAVYDTVSPGQYKTLKNYPDYAEGGVWANGVMAYVPGCASGPADAVMIYDLSTDNVINVTEAKAVPPGLWEEGQAGFPTSADGKRLPYWSDLKWNVDLGVFTINLHLVDESYRIQPYAFDSKGKDVTAEGL